MYISVSGTRRHTREHRRRAFRMRRSCASIKDSCTRRKSTTNCKYTLCVSLKNILERKKPKKQYTLVWTTRLSGIFASCPMNSFSSKKTYEITQAHPENHGCPRCPRVCTLDVAFRGSREREEIRISAGMKLIAWGIYAQKSSSSGEGIFPWEEFLEGHYIIKRKCVTSWHAFPFLSLFSFLVTWWIRENVTRTPPGLTRHPTSPDHYAKALSTISA